MSQLMEKFKEKTREKRLKKKKRWEDERKQDYLKEKARGEEIELTSEERKEISNEVLEGEGLQDKISRVANNVIYFRKPWLQSPLKNFGSLVSTLEDEALRAYVKAKTGKDVEELSTDEVEEEVDLGKDIFVYGYRGTFVTEVKTDSVGKTTIEVNNGGSTLLPLAHGKIKYEGELEGPAREVFDRLYEVSKENLKV